MEKKSGILVEDNNLLRKELEKFNNIYKTKFKKIILLTKMIITLSKNKKKFNLIENCY